MANRIKPNRAVLLLLGIIALNLPVHAHTTEISGDVAGTWHIEPNHSPKAGEPAQVWVALTRQGGAIVPLEQCDCQLAIYADPHPDGAAPLIEPSLEPIAAEQYQGIPGAEVLFPKAGPYELELRGSPKAGAEFQPFIFRYSVLVQRGTSSPTSQTAVNSPTDQIGEPTTSSSQTSRQGTVPVIIATIVGITLGVGALLLIRRSRSQKR